MHLFQKATGKYCILIVVAYEIHMCCIYIYTTMSTKIEVEHATAEK